MPAVAMLLLGHVADEIVVTLNEQTMTETITLTADTLALLAPVDADGDGELTQAELDARADAIRLGVWEQAKLEPCRRSGERASIEPGYVALTAKVDCPPGELTQEFKWLMVLPGNYRVIFGSQVAKGDQRALHLARGETKPLARVSLGSLVVWGVAGGLIATAVGFWLVRRLRR